MFVVIFAWPSFGVVLADDWPCWRETSHDAISGETGLADSWPQSGPPLIWTRNIGNRYSRFIVVRNRFWTQTQSIWKVSPKKKHLGRVTDLVIAVVSFSAYFCSQAFFSNGDFQSEVDKSV